MGLRGEKGKRRSGRVGSSHKRGGTGMAGKGMIRPSQQKVAPKENGEKRGIGQEMFGLKSSNTPQKIR